MLIVGNFLSGSRSIRFVCEDLADRLRAEGRAVVATSSRDARALRLADMLATIWRRRRGYDVAQVDVYSGPAFFWAESAGALLRALGKPHVLTLHGGNLPRFARRFPGRVRRLLAGADAVTSPSPWLARELGGVRSDIAVIPNPIAASAYPFRWRRSAAPKLVWLRAFHALYDPALAPRALARLVGRHPAATLEMIGPDKGDGSLAEARRTAERESVAERVAFVGGIPKDAVPAALDRGDVFVNTTRVDNTPVSLLEAMACGLPVVTTNVGGIPHLVRDGRDALLVPPGDADALAAAVDRIVAEPGLSERLSRAARETAERHDWSRILPRWSALFDGLGRRAA